MGIAMDATARDVTLSLDTGTFAAIAALEGGKHKNNVQKNNSNDSPQNAELKTIKKNHTHPNFAVELEPQYTL